MDRTSIIGLILGIIVVGIGLIMNGVSLTAVLNPAAILIIFAGTAAAILIAFPISIVKKIPRLFVIVFTQIDRQEKHKLIKQFTHWATITRQEGILILENEIDQVDDPFLVSGLRLVIDGQTPDFIRDVLLVKINAMEERHEIGASVFTQAGTYAPTLGVLGAVVGLIAALGNIEDMSVLGGAISAAFMATLFGIFTGYVLWHPFASKLRRKSAAEVEEKQMIIEGLISLTKGESPRILEDKLRSYLSTEELETLSKKYDEEQNNGQEQSA